MRAASLDFGLVTRGAAPAGDASLTTGLLSRVARRGATSPGGEIHFYFPP